MSAIVNRFELSNRCYCITQSVLVAKIILLDPSKYVYLLILDVMIGETGRTIGSLVQVEFGSMLVKLEYHYSMGLAHMDAFQGGYITR